MSRKNNAKLYRARHKAAVERNREERQRSEARRLRRENMRLLTEGLARLGCLPSDKASGAAGASAASAGSSFSSSPSAPSSSARHSHAVTDREEEKKTGESSAASAVNGVRQPEATAIRQDGGEPDVEMGAAQRRREEIRVRKSIWKDTAAGRLAKNKEGSKKVFSGAAASGKKERRRQKPMVLVRGKNEGTKAVIRARDKKILKQMEKRREWQPTMY